MRHYCTMFDINYAAKGLAMIQSLIKHSASGATIHVLAMDVTCQHVLWDVRLPNVQIWSMDFFESTTGVGELRKTRTWQEYCWTVGSVFTNFLKQNVEELYDGTLTYLDADTFFFSDPEPVYAEIGERSIAITPHRFAKKDEARLLPNGKFAVQWVTATGEVGRDCLQRWANQCREWCYYRNEDGKFGDQKYLDEFSSLYPYQVCEIQNPGVGLAPWNIANYVVDESRGHVRVDANPLIMYHFHEYQHGIRLTNWPLRNNDIELVYRPYSAAIEQAQQQVALSLRSLELA